MKKMQEWKINGTITMDVYVTVRAESLEEAMKIADDDVVIEEYVGAQAGVEYCADEIYDADFCDGGMGIEWLKQYAELLDEWEEEDEDDWDDDEADGDYFDEDGGVDFDDEEDE